MSKNKKSTFRRDGFFIQRHDEWLDSPAYRSLSTNARCHLEEFRRIHKPSRNGKLSVSNSNACILLGISENTARNAFRQLEERGFLTLTRDASYVAGKATEYRLTIEPYNGREPSDDWRDWEPDRPILTIGRGAKKQNDPAKIMEVPLRNCGSWLIIVVLASRKCLKTGVVMYERPSEPP